jgi:uncharacterized repeat protein (TIGR01451 family)
MKKWIGVFASLLLVSVAFAQEPQGTAAIPTTANKIEGPVTGKLQDAITVTANQRFHVRALNMDSVHIRFCTEALSILFKQKECVTPNHELHHAGQRVPVGIQMNPSMEGEWRWDSDYDLMFKPAKPWPAGAHYDVKIDASIFPENIKFQKPGAIDYAFDTYNVSASISRMEFMQDPNHPDKRVVMATIDFNMPVEEADVRNSLRFSLEEVDRESKESDKLIVKMDRLPFEFHRMDNDRGANLSVPLNSLPDDETFMILHVANGIHAISGGKPSDSQVNQRVLIPGRLTYAKFEKINLNIVKNENGIPEQLLLVETNVAVAPDDLAKHMQVYLLPKDKTDSDGKVIKNYAWQSGSLVTNDVLAKSTTVSFQPNPVDEGFATLNSFKVNVEAGRWLYVKLGKGIAAKGGFVLSQPSTTTMRVPDFTREVRIMSQGGLLSLSGEKKISVYSLGAQKLHFILRRVLNEDINHLVSQTRGSFKNPDFINYYFSSHNISERFNDDLSLPSAEMNKPQYSVFDFTPYLTKTSQEKKWIFNDEPKGKGLFFLTVAGVSLDENGNEYAPSQDDRFVLISDMGLIVKTNAIGAHDVFVQSIKTGEPISGAEVSVLGLNGLSVVTVTTDGDGHAIIPNLQELSPDKQPVAYVARYGGDLSFMPYENRDRALNYSKFDTDGLHVSENEMQAFLFSDRGIYRPGEHGHIGIVVKQSDWSKSLADVPLQLEMTNPRGQIVEKQILKLNAVGLAEYEFSTHETSPTGTYNFRLYVVSGDKKGNQLGSVSARIEEFLPDTLKISSAFSKPKPKGWTTPNELKTMVTLQHLYGAPAVDHRVKATISVTPSGFSFKEFEGYQFFDALQGAKSFDQPLGDMQTDKDGKAVFDLNLARFGNSTYELSVSADGFAQDSGRSVHTSSDILVSSLSYVVGMKPDSNLGYINRKQKRAVQFIAVSPDLKPVDIKKMRAKLIEITHVSSLIKDESGLYAYRSVPKETVVAQGDYDIAAKGSSYVLDTEKPGDFMLVLSDEKGTVLHRVHYTVIGGAGVRGTKDASLTINLDKQIYNANDTITMNVASPYTGAGLITLETDKILAFKWFKASTTSSTQTINVPKGFTGKGYVNVQFLRSPDSKEIYASPLSYRVVPFFVSTESINSQIKLTVPEKAKPGDTVTIKYQTKKPSKVIVYAVDEGILQYTHYRTPDPLDYYVNHRALQIGTAQLLDLVMPEYSVLQSLSAAGGGDDGARERTLNPFKRKAKAPVVYWSGIIDADEKSRELRYTVPDYFNGTLRFMAVAVSEQTMGSLQAQDFVQGDIIISPNVPTFAAPGDEFVVGAAIANNIVGSGKNAKIRVNVTPSEHLEIIDGKDSEVSVAEGNEAKIRIRVKTKSVLGGASLTFTASASGKSTKTQEILSVRPPLPRMTALLSGYAERGEKEVKQTRDLYKEYGSIDGALSTLPVSLIPGLRQYLDRFPYGCTEQTISKAFPAVALYGQKDLGADSNTVEQSVTQAMHHLRELQNGKGGFGYWWYFGSEPDDFISVYALHYMTLAKEKHLFTPDETFRKSLDYVKTMVNRSPHSLNGARVQAYGIYLLTRNGIVTANYIPNVIRYLETEHKNVWKHDLAAVYIAAAYKLMQLTPEANKLMEEFALGEPEYWRVRPSFWADYRFYNSLNRYAQYLEIVSDHFPEMLTKIDRNIFFRVANFIGEGSFNTLSSSYAIVGLSAYGQATIDMTQAKLAISQKSEAGTWQPITLTGNQVKRAQLALTKGDVKFSGGDGIGLFYQIVTDGFERDSASRPIEDGLEIKHIYQDADKKPVTTVNVGDVIEVVITMRSHDNKSLSNMAFVDLIPAGFEIVPESVSRPAVDISSRSNDDEEDDDNSDRNSNALSSPSFTGGSWLPEAVDVREDRVIAYGQVSPSEEDFRYKIKAVNAGTFVAPPAYIESMYERSIKARGVTGSITVK